MYPIFILEKVFITKLRSVDQIEMGKKLVALKLEGQIAALVEFL